MPRPRTFAALMLLFAAASASRAADLHKNLAKYVSERQAEFDQIEPERKASLQQLAAYVQARQEEGQPVRMTFICTHNSRRSHLAQLWAAVAADQYGVKRVETFSGGTEATAFNPRAVAALRRVGFRIPEPSRGDNPRYEVSFSEDADPQVCFSKTYQDSPNPTEGFCAVMTCSQADQSCPIVVGATRRIAIPYEDPKVADGALIEADRYDERCAQIAREMLYAFSQAANP